MVGEKFIIANWTKNIKLKVSIPLVNRGVFYLESSSECSSLKSRTENLLKELQEMNSKEGNSFNVGSISKQEIKFTLSALKRERGNEMELPVSFGEKLAFFGVVVATLSVFIIGFLSLMTYLLAY